MSPLLILTRELILKTHALENKVERRIPITEWQSHLEIIVERKSTGTHVMLATLSLNRVGKAMFLKRAFGIVGKEVWLMKSGA